MIIAIGKEEGQLNENVEKKRETMQTMSGLIDFPMAESEELIDMERNLMRTKRIISLMGSQINDLLEYTKIEKGTVAPKRQIFSKDELHRQIELLLQPLSEDKELSYELDFSGMADVAFMTDKGMLVQLFWQLLDNAAQYTDEGGNISFKAYTIKKNRKEITNCFVIQDNGIGMSKEFQKHIFQPFVRERNRMSRQVEGTGLGLYIVWQIVKLMHGKVQVESKEDEGTCITIELTNPVCNVMHEGKAKHLEDITLLRNKRVILYEENPEKQGKIRKCLEKAGMLVETAQDGYEVIELFEQSNPYYYDAILIQAGMTVMSGLEITSRIRQLDRDDAYLIPMIALVADANDENIQKLIESGMDAQIEEPIKTRELLKTLMKFWKRYKE